MNRRRDWWISLTAVVCSALVVYGVYMLLIRQVELQQTVYVVVPKKFISAGSVITSDMVELKPITEGGFHEQMLTSLDQVTGKEALVPLGTGEPILGWKVGKYSLLPSTDEATFQIPKSYILSIASGIRAGDLVDVYVSGKMGTVLLLERVQVASLRSSSNQEVDNPDDPQLLARARNDLESMYLSRREANASIDQINLNLTEEQWRMIDEACRNEDNKLVIAFRNMFPVTGEEGM